MANFVILRWLLGNIYIDNEIEMIYKEENLGIFFSMKHAHIEYLIFF